MASDAAIRAVDVQPDLSRADRSRRSPAPDRCSTCSSCRRSRRTPAADSRSRDPSAIAASSASGRMRNSSSSSIFTTFSRPMPSASARLVDRRMRVRRAVDAQPRQIGAARHAALADLELRLRLARRGEREHRRDRRRVVRDAEPAVAQAEHLPQPIGGDLLELRRGGRRLPQHRLHVERRGRAARRECPAPTTTSRSSRRTPG